MNTFDNASNLRGRLNKETLDVARGAYDLPTAVPLTPEPYSGDNNSLRTLMGNNAPKQFKNGKAPKSLAAYAQGRDKIDANHGQVLGPGGPTDDMQPAMVSDQEAVLTGVENGGVEKLQALFGPDIIKLLNDPKVTPDQIMQQMGGMNEAEPMRNGMEESREVPHFKDGYDPFAAEETYARENFTRRLGDANANAAQQAQQFRTTQVQAQTGTPQSLGPFKSNESYGRESFNNRATLANANAATQAESLRFRNAPSQPEAGAFKPQNTFARDAFNQRAASANANAATQANAFRNVYGPSNAPASPLQNRLGDANAQARTQAAGLRGTGFGDKFAQSFKQLAPYANQANEGVLQATESMRDVQGGLKGAVGRLAPGLTAYDAGRQLVESNPYQQGLAEANKRIQGLFPNATSSFANTLLPGQMQARSEAPAAATNPPRTVAPTNQPPLSPPSLYTQSHGVDGSTRTALTPAGYQQAFGNEPKPNIAALDAADAQRLGPIQAAQDPMNQYKAYLQAQTDAQREADDYTRTQNEIAFRNYGQTFEGAKPVDANAAFYPQQAQTARDAAKSARQSDLAKTQLQQATERYKADQPVFDVRMDANGNPYEFQRSGKGAGAPQAMDFTADDFADPAMQALGKQAYDYAKANPGETPNPRIAALLRAYLGYNSRNQ